MAIYHLHVGFVSRSTGRTSVQSAAYICGEKLHEDYRNKDVNYSNKRELVCYETIAPEHSKYKDLSVWNKIENFENRYAENYYKTEQTKNNYLSSARTARTIVLALPKELSNECNKELVEKFARENFLSRNLIITYAIHNANGNPHAHLQVSLRAIGEDGEFVNRKDREIYTKSFLYETRKLWANLANEILAREGINERITEKSYADNDREVHERIAEKYLEIEKLGSSTVLCSTNEECKAINDKIRSLKKESKEIGDDFVKVNGRDFSKDDKIMFLENNRGLGVKNGQCATVSGRYSVTFEGANVGVLIARLESGSHVAINTWEYSKIDYAYAITLHKSQGKTYDNTIFLTSKKRSNGR